MATTTSTSLADSVAAELVAEDFVKTAYSAVIGAPKMRSDTLSGSLTKSYAMLTAVTSAALTEGTDGTTTTLADTQVSGTLAEIGQGIALTDLMKVGSSVTDLVRQITSLLAKGYAKKVDTDVLAELANLTDSVSGTGAAMTEDQFLQAMYETEANDYVGYTLGAFLYPKQAHNLSAAIGGVTENQSAIFARQEILSGISPAMANGFKYSLYGVDVFLSTNIATANAAADSNGGIVVIGEDSPIVRTVGLLDGSPWDGRLEIERDASLRATEAWFTGAMFAATIAPAAGCQLITDR